MKGIAYIIICTIILTNLMTSPDQVKAANNHQIPANDEISGAISLNTLPFTNIQVTS